ncbi:MAG: hypothetical protein UW60_C0039G0007 [Candidatus Woesebacteria bacterium GW2011_GWA2_44_33]|uniref:Uncharacterized protein n=1 Tax=Candidatus Woesebacteria bacterium GW2011_GWA2_44_33 TaxID=1618564 RepID=A0A0G1M124_9BACT|nr:MAG: hypothetical protein UW60_C0039G0007 [Candidatus Woesebacteria bacterium GW2011_GWA2_44_33]
MKNEATPLSAEFCGKHLYYYTFAVYVAIFA